ncbi:hypothetical protein [Bdellovibrio bacteriovorus]|uniref:hypothetical protein n=1 Tax=Bdellovibrio bacteriovorus TaxID=959 RepID=UPI0035A64A99
MKSIFSILLTFWCVSSFAGDKVAVLFVGDSHPVLKEREASAIKFYETYGFKIIRLSPYAKTKAEKSSFEKNLRQLKNVDSLHVEFLGHGIVKDDKYYLAVSDGINTDYKKSIEVQDLKNSLQAFQKSNPQAETTVYALNCYSGKIPETLSDLPKTQAFASTRSDLKAWTMKVAGDEVMAHDFPVFFQRALDQGSSYEDAFLKASEDYKKIQMGHPAQFPFTNPAVFSLPRSQAQAFVENRCRDSKENSSLKISEKRAKIIKNLLSQSTSNLKYLNDLKNKTGCSKKGMIETEKNELKKNRSTFEAAAIEQLKALIQDGNMETDLPRMIENLQGEMDFYRESDDEASELRKAEIRSRLEELYAINDEAGFEEYKKRKIEDLANDLKACDQKPAPSACSQGKAAYMETVFMDWSKTSLNPRHVINKCARPIPALASAEQTFKESQRRQDCFKQHVGKNAVDTYLAFTSNSKPIASYCEMIKPHEDFYSEEARCIEKFAAGASEKSWARLEEIAQMGSEKINTQSSSRERSKSGVR